MNIRGICAASVILLLGCGAAWRWYLPAGEASANPSHPVAAMRPGVSESTLDAGLRKAPASSPTSKSEPADHRPFSEIRPELEQRARAGDAKAARRLGEAFAYCNNYQPMSASQLEDVIVGGMASGMSVREGGKVMSPESLLMQLKASRAQADRVCKGTTGIRESLADARKLAFAWIERGAALGDVDAQALYASLAFNSYDARTALANAEELRERKRLATDYLQRSLAQGDALALMELARSYSNDMLYPADAETAYAYLYAYSLTSRASDMAPESLAFMLASSSGKLDEATKARAQDEGRKLAACCRSMQESP